MRGRRSASPADRCWRGAGRGPARSGGGVQVTAWCHRGERVGPGYGSDRCPAQRTPDAEPPGPGAAAVLRRPSGLALECAVDITPAGSCGRTRWAGRDGRRRTQPRLRRSTRGSARRRPCRSAGRFARREGRTDTSRHSRWGACYPVGADPGRSSANPRIARLAAAEAEARAAVVGGGAPGGARSDPGPRAHAGTAPITGGTGATPIAGGVEPQHPVRDRRGRTTAGGPVKLSSVAAETARRN